ncbi:hypothetical protein BDV34DRAFT_84141 [Aspergillus parasiticus]|uniref:Uncharacterized protein n=1 Tax=Aspergillus parasiticus TaxID=5067 RepID=A0A5N6DMK7_ASPPA|nr:hypothetical protein BDV34DRAFT_84141 [Aspergillus parasiticus]
MPGCGFGSIQSSHSSCPTRHHRTLREGRKRLKEESFCVPLTVTNCSVGSIIGCFVSLMSFPQYFHWMRVVLTTIFHSKSGTEVIGLNDNSIPVTPKDNQY